MIKVCFGHSNTLITFIVSSYCEFLIILFCNKSIYAVDHKVGLGYGCVLFGSGKIVFTFTLFAINYL